MRIIFAGTPDFAATALAALIAAGHEIPLVLTQPDRPAGRGMKLAMSPVKQLAQQHGLAIAQPASLKDLETQAQLAATGADVMVVVAYGLILPAAVLQIPRHGCLNIHASLLPRWRGAAPIQRALLAGDRETGITIIQMDAGLDTGPMLLRAPLPIAEDDTAQTLHDRLATLGAQTIVQALAGLAAGNLVAEPQDDALATYASKLSKTEARLNWRQSAEELARAVRGYNSVPVAQGVLDGAVWRIWAAEAVAEARGDPGEVLAVDKDGILIACGQGALRLTELQKAGGKRQPVASFLQGNPVRVGQRLEA